MKSRLEQPQARRVKHTSLRRQTPHTDRPSNTFEVAGNMTEALYRADDKIVALSELERSLDRLDALWVRHLAFLDQYQKAQGDIKKLFAAVRLP